MPSTAKTLGSRRVRRRSVWALPSKPPWSAMISASARSPLCPNGGWPRSWARHAVSTTSGSHPSARPISRPTCATSRLCVRRVRTKSSEPGPRTWVLAPSRRSAEEWTTRARSRSKGVRALLLGGSGTQRSTSWAEYPRALPGIVWGTGPTLSTRRVAVVLVPRAPSRAAAAQASSACAWSPGRRAQHTSRLRPAATPRRPGRRPPRRARLPSRAGPGRRTAARRRLP